MNKDLFLPSNVSWFRLPDYVKAMYEAEVDNSAANLLAFGADGKPVFVEKSSVSGGSLTAGTGIDITASVVALDAASQASLAAADTALQPAISGVVSNPATTLTPAMGGSISWAGTESNLYKVTLTEPSTLENASAPVTDAVYQFIFTQDATGGRTLALGSNFRQADGVAAIDLSSAPANSKTIVTALYDGTVFMVTSVGNYPA